MKSIICRMAWGAGLGHGMWNIMVLEEFCKKFNRQLGIDWSYSNYTSKEDMGKQNIFTKFFKGINTTIPMLYNNEVFDYYPKNTPTRWGHISSGWIRDGRRQELITKYFNNDMDVNDDIFFVEEHVGWDFKFAGSKYNFFILQDFMEEKIINFLTPYVNNNIIGVHLRHGNGESLYSNRIDINNNEFESLIQKYFKEIDKLLDDNTKVLLCTDSLYILDKFKKRYNKKLVLYSKEFKAPNTGALHVPSKKEWLILKDGYKNLEDALIEMWLLSRSDHIVCGRSLFSDVAVVISNKLDKTRNQTNNTFIDNTRI